MQVTPASNASLVLARHMETAAAHDPRSWDCWDAMSPAYDELRHSMPDACAITCAYIDYLGGVPLTDHERMVVGAGIRHYGKLYAHAVGEAIGRTDEWSLRAWNAYGSAVCRRTMAARRPTPRWEESPAVKLSRDAAS